MKGRLFEQKGACGLPAMNSFAFPVILLKTGEGEQSICLSLLAKGKATSYIGCRRWKRCKREYGGISSQYVGALQAADFVS